MNFPPPFSARCLVIAAVKVVFPWSTCCTLSNHTVVSTYADGTDAACQRYLNQVWQTTHLKWGLARLNRPPASAA